MTRSKRPWTEHEDDKLIKAWLDMHAAGKYTADRGFKPGHLATLEDVLAIALPDSGLKAEPHIRSRMKTLKSNFNTVHDMIHGPNTSGFHWDPKKQCVVAEKAIWDSYLQKHKHAAQFKNRPFPHYDSLAILFGKTRASGNAATLHDSLTDDLNKTRVEETGFGLDIDDSDRAFNSGSPPTPTSGNTTDDQASTPTTLSGGKRRRSNLSPDSTLAEAVNKPSAKKGDPVEKRSDPLAIALFAGNATAKMNDLHDRLVVEIRNLAALSENERHDAMIIIGTDDKLLSLFFRLFDEEKTNFIRRLLRRQGN